MPVVQTITVVCEGPGCKTGSGETRFTLTWDPESAKRDPFAIPDAAFRCRTILLFNGEQHTFCGKDCEHAWESREERPLKTPREIAAEQTAAAQHASKQEARAARKGNVIPFNNPKAPVIPDTPETTYPNPEPAS